MFRVRKSLGPAGFREDSPPRLTSSFRNRLTRDEALMEWMVRLLWRAFPQARSENELADLIADHLTTGGEEVSARTVRYWLRQQTTPNFKYVPHLFALAGAEAVLNLLQRRKGT
jgi:hypothetical protein